MAQTTGAMTMGIAQIEYSDDAATWVDISGQSQSITFSGGDQLIGELFTLDGDYPIVLGSGKVGSITATVNIVYTETADEGFDGIWDRFEGTANIKTVALRMSPAGGDSTELRFFSANDAGTAAVVPIVNILPPDIDDSGGVTTASFSVTAPQFVRETIA